MNEARANLQANVNPGQYFFQHENKANVVPAECVTVYLGTCVRRV